MRLLIALLLLPLAGGVTADSPRPGRSTRNLVRRQNKTTTTAPGKYIVEAAEGTNLGELASQVEAAGAKVLRKFQTPGVFTGLSVQSAEDNINSLEEVPLVSRAWHVARIPLGPVDPEGFSDDAAAGNYSVHAFTGVQQLHKEGIFGKGVRVAVVDTGTDYNHPALGGGFGPGFKIAGGYDLVGDSGWPDFGPKVPDSDPFDTYGHGTHVAGIIAGKSEWFTGVAPEAELYSYKVFAGGSSGFTDEDTLIEAFLRAFDDGADIITSSIGGTDGFTDNPWALVASRLVDQGVIVTISAGNSGEDGAFYASSGSSGKNVIAVASTDPKVLSADPFQATFSLDGQSNTTGLAYAPNGGLWTITGLPIVPISLDATVADDACSPLPASTPDLSNAIALVRRGTCTFSLKQQNLEPFGARYVLFYNLPDRAFTTPSTTNFNSEIAMIEGKAGEAIVATVKAGGNVTADFSYRGDWAVGAQNSAGGVPSYYTSWGPLNELESKPDVAAPGARIYSTYLDGSWAVLSGTSMACPYVAGIAALYISKHGGRAVHGTGFGKALTDRIRASGGALPYQLTPPANVPVNYGFWAPVPQVGAGQVNASKVLKYATSLRFEPIALNDTAQFSRYHKVDITNNGAGPVTYSFSLQPAGTFNAQAFLPDFVAALDELLPYSYVPTVSFPSGTFTVQPGQTRTAQFNFAPPQGLDASKLPVYSGKVLISGTDGEELSVPYVGAGFDLKTHLRRNLFSGVTPYQRAGPARQDIDAYHVYDFSLPGLIEQKFPQLFYECKMATRQIRWDVFEAGWKEHMWKYPPVPGRDGYVGSATSSVWADRGPVSFDPEFMDREDVDPLPRASIRSSYVGDATFSLWWFGKPANGTYIAPGNYVFRFAAMVPMSNPHHSDNWDIWSTPEITVLPYTV